MAKNDTATVAQNSQGNVITVLANDENVAAGSVIRVVEPFVHGSTSLTADGTAVRYTPTEGYCNTGVDAKPDTFTYALENGSTATLSVTVTCPAIEPVANKDEYQVSSDFLTVGAPGVLSNDTPQGSVKVVGCARDASRQPRETCYSSNILGGHLNIRTDGSFEYVGPVIPSNDGVETFSYTIESSTGTRATSTVTFRLGSLVVNDGGNIGN